MRPIRAWLLRVLGLFGQGRHDRELAEEIHSHVDAHIADNLRAGMTPEQARRDALMTLGGVDLIKDQYRDRRGIPALETLIRNYRYALRILRKNPGFSGVAVLTLALGLGATTAMFSIVNGVLLEPLKYREPSRLYLGRMHAVAFLHIASSSPVNARHFHEWRANCRSCEQVALVEGVGFTLTHGGEPERLPGLRMSYNFFRTLGVQPSLGRDFLPEEELPGHSHVVILSDSLWRSHFASDPSIVGRTILVDGEPDEIIGVMPSSVHLPKGDQWGPLFAHDRASLIFRPLGFDASSARGWGMLNYSSIVRLKPGVQPQQAAAEMNAGIAQFAREFKFDEFGWKAILIPLQDQVTEGARSALWLLLGTVGAVLLIVCVNVGNLMLVRTTSRHREASIRIALGAGRSGLFGLVMNEALVLVAIGGGLGLLLAYGGLKLFVAAAPVDLPRLEDVRMDWTVLTFAALSIVFSTLACGLVPAWRLATTNPQESLKAGSKNTTETGRRLRLSELMVGIEVALSTVLLVAGGLLMVSFFRLMHVEKGFEVDHIVTQGVSLISPKYRQAASQTRFIDEVLQKLGGVPGVRSVGVTNQIPLRGETWIDGLADPDMAPGVERQSANFRFVSPDYWNTMGIQIKHGRFIEAADRNHPVAVLSEKAARYLWPDTNPLGKHIRATGLDNKPPLEVVGIVSDIREGLGKEPPAMVYEPYWLMNIGGPSFVLRTSASPAAVAGAIRSIVHSVDPDVPLMAPQSMDQIVDESVAARRFQMYLAVAFAAAALILASLGIYGVIAFTVVRRTPEIGVRIALGARTTQLMTMVLRQGMQPVVVGLAVGLTVAILGGRVLASQLYGVAPDDPLTISSVGMLLLFVALCACWFPARRATRIDPLQALRFE